VARFADYDPLRRGSPPPDGLVSRAATPSDLPELAAIRAERDAVRVEDAAAAFERRLREAARSETAVRVALVGGRIAGYGVVGRLALPGLPEGWYLGGLVVAPAHRRRGIGARLTRERLEWIGERAREAYYFANERNRASIDLHAAFGFREIARDIRVPGVTFTDGRGLLFVADLPPT
jgi:ribosomal protein S18 acetylase RimI-like enzyme